MFDSLLKLTVNTVKLVSTPVEIAAELANVVVEPVADVMDEGAKEIKKTLDDLKE